MVEVRHFLAHPATRQAATCAGPVATERSVQDAPEQAAIFCDVTDLLLYLLRFNTLSGIQRVQCELLRNLLDISHPQPLHFVALSKNGGLGVIETSALLEIIEDVRSNSASRADIEAELNALLNRVVPCNFRSRDIFLSLGAFWTVRRMSLLLQNLKNSGVIIGLFIHDIIPITSPEYFESAIQERLFGRSARL